MPTVLALMNSATQNLHLFTVETTTGPIIVVYFDEARLRSMARTVLDKIKPSTIELRRLDFAGETLDDCIEYLAEHFPTASAHCIADDHDLWPRVLAGMQGSRSFTLPADLD